MAMNYEDSIRWQEESLQEQLEQLRATLGDNINEAALGAMACLYREGWRNCFSLARLHGVARLKS